MAGYTVKAVNEQVMKEKALEVRRLVFIQEQNVPEELEIDEHDEETNGAVRHFIALDESGQAVGTARLRAYNKGIGKAERVAVLPSHRSGGVGYLLMKKLEEEAKQEGYHSIKLHSQTHARPFYERLGYEAQGDIFMDAGIEHIEMIKSL
ncbi:GNAT family N-acetyltransferase [Aneurinibacillus tyrosinisolvens]|uniref:GNAT family N-acetyltransferase n=1 Tax=Aneurinibacillus tyrosinisolvens TaxID=1443435 RepID=UPI00063FB0EA|nr:GNAT family N-acetyltransferase [Aneurinibacillus tyrosinisolvens]